MSRSNDEQHPGPAVEPEPEPRLLTRSAPVTPTPPPRASRQNPQHDPESGLRAWAGRLPRSRRSQRPQAKARRRWPALLALSLLALVLVAATVMVFDLRHAMRAALPQLDGQVQVSGLRAPVTVTRDAEGVPSISAASLDDLLFAQGYITAGDRLWQMDGLRRHAAGELAEILGPGLVEHDRRQRYLQIRAAADRAVAQLPPDQLQQLEAYSRGVNAFLATHRNALPVEFRLLAYKPAPWSPRDSLLVSLAMWQDLSTEFPQKLNREALSAHLSPDLLPDLYPVGSWRDQPPAAQSPSLTTPHAVEEIPLDPSQAHARPLPPSSDRPDELVAVSAALAVTDHCQGCRSGSNNWAVSGAHTASGAPLLSNDMHLSLGIPDIWYEARLHIDAVASAGPESRMDVVGFTLPGVPFVIVGRNQHVAWGVTNLGADVQDLRLEHLRGAGQNTEYQRADGSWAPANHHPERIRVRGGRDLSLDVLTTTHTVGAAGAGTMETPVISPLYPSERRSLSLAWTAYDPAAVTSPFFAVNTAPDGSSLVAAMAGFGGPSLNLVWADAGGHIGYHAVGRIPIRGPAVQHPRAAPAALPANTPGDLPPDEGDEGDGQGAARLSAPEFHAGPHLMLSAYRPLRHRAQARRNAPAVPTPAHSRRSRLVQPLATAAPAAPEAPLLPQPQPVSYTIGSPISPLPVDALDPGQAWSGYIAYSDLPSVTDPPGGLLATANARVTPIDYPWAVANDWTDPFRAERIVHLLTGRSALTPADMLSVQTDVKSDVNQAIAQRLAYALDHASAQALAGDPRRLRQAADLLRTWNGQMSADSPGAAVLAAVRPVLWPSLLVPQLLARKGIADPAKGSDADLRRAAAVARLYTWNEEITALELLLQNQPPRWLPRPYTSWNDFLAAVTEHGLKAAGAPANLAHWRFGDRHTAEIDHPIFGQYPVLSRLLDVAGGSGAQPAPGDATTIDAIGAHFGPSQRFTADLASPETAFGNITTGQSGNPRSPWYLDQFRPWLRGTTFDLPGAHSEAVHSLELLPQ